MASSPNKVYSTAPDALNIRRLLKFFFSTSFDCSRIMMLTDCKTPSVSLLKSNHRPIVSHREKRSNAVVLILVAILAWPWNVALSAVEGRPVNPSGAPTATARGSAIEGHRVTRLPRPTAASAPAILPDYDEETEEGDDIGPFQSSSGILLSVSGSVLFAQALRLPTGPRARPPGRSERLGRMRC